MAVVFFQKRGYPFYIIEQAKCKCTAILQSEALKGKNEGIIDHPSIIPLVPFHYFTIEIGTIVQKKCESCQQLRFWSSFLGKNRHYIQVEQNHKQVLVRRKLKNGKLSGIIPHARTRYTTCPLSGPNDSINLGGSFNWISQNATKIEVVVHFNADDLDIMIYRF